MIKCKDKQFSYVNFGLDNLCVLDKFKCTKLIIGDHLWDLQVLLTFSPQTMLSA